MSINTKMKSTNRCMRKYMSTCLSMSSSKLDLVTTLTMNMILKVRMSMFMDICITMIWIMNLSLEVITRI